MLWLEPIVSHPATCMATLCNTSNAAIKMTGWFISWYWTALKCLHDSYLVYPLECPIIIWFIVWITSDPLTYYNLSSKLLSERHLARLDVWLISTAYHLYGFFLFICGLLTMVHMYAMSMSAAGWEGLVRTSVMSLVFISMFLCYVLTLYLIFTLLLLDFNFHEDPG